MCTIDEARYRCNEIAAAAGYKITVPIEINGRLKSTLGRVKFRYVGMDRIVPYVIEFSKAYLENASDKELDDVFKHELAHYFVTKETGENHGHDRVFKEMCGKLGTKEDGIYVGRGSAKFKYDIICPECNKVVDSRKRICKVIKEVESGSCISKCCGVKLICRQNW